MVRVAFEGVDGSGKSTALFGLHNDDTFIPGVQQRLDSLLTVPVRPTREPGSLTYSDGAEPAWDTTPLMQIESHLNEASFWTGMARFQVNEWSEGPEPGTPFFAAKSGIMVAEFMRRHRTLPSSIKDCLLRPGTSSWPEALSEELRQIQSDHEEAYDLVHDQPSLRSKFSTYDARDCLRHALVGAADSDEFPPEAKGLLFFASHIFNNRRLDSKMGGRSVSIFDRTGESQRAYGRARGGNQFIENLYDKHGTDPDLVVLLTVEPGEGLRRKGGPGSDWETLETLRRAQDAYRERAEETDFDWIEIRTGDASPKSVIQSATDQVLSWMAENRPMPSADPELAATS